MQVHKCDECGKIGEPGETWVSVYVAPFYIPGNQQFYDRDEAMPGPSRGATGAVCSTTCALDRLRRSLDDLATYADQMHDGVSLLGDELAAKVFQERS